jgi:predicted permease
MRTLRRFFIQLAASVTGRHDEKRLREEIEEHLELQTAENVRAGLSPAEARRQAVLKFGPPQAMKEHYRDAEGLPAIEGFLQDARYTLRQFRNAPVFTLTATLSLALGIGANTAVFTVIEHVFMRAMPVSDPQELVFVTDQRSQEDQSPRFSYPFYTALRDNQVMKGTAARFSLTLNATINGQVGRVRGELVSGNYFSVVGAATHVGRPLTPDDDHRPGADALAVISDGFWRRTFGADPSVLGRSVRLNDQTFAVIGVAAEGFTGTDVGSPTDVWLPLTMQREVGRDLLADARTNWLEIFGRLDPTRSLGQAGAELTAYLDRRAPDAQAHFTGRHLILLPGGKGNSLVRRELGSALRVLMVLTALAMVLACVNVANLFMLRSASREKEIAVRVALGAGPSRLTRQFLAETLVLATVAGVAALLAAPWAARLVVAAQPYAIDIDTSLNARIFIFALTVSALSAVVVALAPIFGSRSVGFSELVGNSSGPSSSSQRNPRLRDLVVTLQIAMSVAMLIIAGLLIQSLRGLKSIDPGFRADDLLLITMDPAAAGYDGERLQRFWRDATERVSQIRGVRSTSLAGTVPFATGRQRQPWINPTSGEVSEIDTNFVGPQYFRTLGVPLVGGREFTELDGKVSAPVIIINERLARMFWPQQDPVGMGLRLASPEDLQRKGPLGPSGVPVPEVVGVVRDVKYRDLRGDSAPMVYKPLFQTSSSDAMALHVRAATDPSALVWTIRSEMQRLDANVPLFGISTLEDQLDGAFAQTRQAARLTGVFGILALLLSGLGVYGVTALAASRRTREVGVRIALGAQRRHIVALIGRRGLTLTLAGLSLGLLGAVGFAQLAQALLFGVTATTNGATYVSAAALVGLVSLLGCCIPLRAATRLDVAETIRCE